MHDGIDRKMEGTMLPSKMNIIKVIFHWQRNCLGEFFLENLQSFPPGMVIFIEYQASETGFWTQQGLTRTSVIPLGGAGVNEAFQVS